VSCGWRPRSIQLVRPVSPATLGRLLAPARATRPRRGATTTHVGTWLRHEIPLRTFTEWDDAGPGFLEVDLVAHCGRCTKDFYLCTLCAVDIATACRRVTLTYEFLRDGQEAAWRRSGGPCLAASARRPW
jgi:hypothetical protein